jgi:S1-C subfamily serine protease
MRNRVYSAIIAVGLFALTLVGITNLYITYDLQLNTDDSIQRAENYFPIESFVMVTQDLTTFQEICNSEGEDCLPVPVPEYQVSGTGSGVIVGQRDGKSLVVTAGHVCVGPSEYVPMTERFNSQYILELETGYGHTGSGTVIAVDMINDLCLIISDTHLGPALEVHDEEPMLHEKVYNMASPLGLAVPVAVPVFDGYFSGQVASLYIFTIPAAPGSSGSPVLNEDKKIISIINAAAVSFDEYAIGCKTQALRNFLISAGVI